MLHLGTKWSRACKCSVFQKRYAKFLSMLHLGTKRNNSTKNFAKKIKALYTAANMELHPFIDLEGYTHDGDVIQLHPFIDLEGYTHDGDVIQPRVERMHVADITPLPESAEDQIKPALKATAILMAAGMQVDMTVDEENAARKAFTQEVPITKMQLRNPAIVLKLNALLNEYDHQVVKDADQIRRYTTNKLIELSDNKNPTTQLRALELLGKISDVGLFAERSIITIEQLPTAELQAKLKKTVELLLDPSEYKVLNP